ncbi:MAG: hypothetical protein ACLRWQ_21705 [Flavonifractor plautii]
MSVDFEAIRKQEWPVLEQMVFLDAACVSFAPQRTVRAVKAFADMTATQEEENSSAHHIAMDALRRKAYDEARQAAQRRPGGDRPGGEHLPLAQHRRSAALSWPARRQHHHHQSGVHPGGPALVRDAPARRRSRSGSARPRTTAFTCGGLRRPGQMRAHRIIVDVHPEVVQRLGQRPQGHR